jgi:multiple sugar transport system substrate-binding protein
MSDENQNESSLASGLERRMSRRDILKLGGSAALASLALPLLPELDDAVDTAFAASRETASLKGNLTIWTYFDQVNLAAKQFMKKYPNVHVDVKVFPGDTYETKMRLALQTHTSPPDIFDMDVNYLGKYIDGPFPENLTKMGANSLMKNYVPYVRALANDVSGVVRAVTDTSSPGGYWYRRDVAKKYLGKGDPKSMSAMVDTFPNLIKNGKKVVKASGGKVHLIASYDDVIMDARHQMTPWVYKGKFSIDPKWNHVLDVARTIYNDNLDAKLGAFSPAWGAAWNDGSVITFGWPSWASFEIDPKKTGNNWGVAQSPTPYYEGGRYSAIYSQSSNKQLAYEYLKFLASPAWQIYNLKQTQNMPALQSVFKQLSKSYKPALFGGQPIMAAYYTIAMRIPPYRSNQFYEDVHGLIYGVISDAFKAHQSNAQIFDAFKKQVRQKFPELKVS